MCYTRRKIQGGAGALRESDDTNFSKPNGQSRNLNIYGARAVCVFINFVYKLNRCLQHHHTNDVMLRITSLLVTVDFAASLLYNYILSPLLMVMSLARTAETDMFIEVQFYIFRDTDNDAAYPIVSRNICDFMSTLFWQCNDVHCLSSVTALLLCPTMHMTKSVGWWEFFSSFYYFNCHQHHQKLMWRRILEKEKTVIHVWPRFDTMKYVLH